MPTCQGFWSSLALVLRSINMTLWGVHLDFRKPALIYGLSPSIIFRCLSGALHFQLWLCPPFAWWLWTRHFAPNAWNFKCFLISCILNHRKYLQLCVNLQKTTDYTFLLGGCIINQRSTEEGGRGWFVNIKVHFWPGVGRCMCKKPSRGLNWSQRSQYWTCMGYQSPLEFLSSLAKS